MKNQECYDKNGKFLGWFSRSVAVVCATFAQDLDNNTYVLASQRGEGTPDPEFVGAWNLVCGYLDFDETCAEACIRETFEETGVELPKACVREIIYIDDPKADKRQNLVHRFVCVLPKTIDNYSFSHKHNEKNEVGAIKWIPVDKVDDYKWAFGHEKIIKDYYNNFVKF